MNSRARTPPLHLTQNRPRAFVASAARTVQRLTSRDDRVAVVEPTPATFLYYADRKGRHYFATMFHVDDLMRARREHARYLVIQPPDYGRNIPADTRARLSRVARTVLRNERRLIYEFTQSNSHRERSPP